MTTQILSNLCQAGRLLYATNNVYSLVIDAKNRNLIEIPKCHLDNCFCQKVAKCVGIDISYDHVYKRCDVSTNVNRQVIYKCPFGFSNIIVPVFKGTELIAALQAGPVLNMSADEYLEKRVLPLWNLSDDALEELRCNLMQYPSGDINYLVALSEVMSTLISGVDSNSVVQDEELVVSDHRISNNLVNSILDFVTANYAENITLSDAAKYAYVNPSHLSRVFNKKMNCNFRSYLNSIR
ncbi:MAG: PocR ligand-binding domain-containing protein, partial [Bacillota bacterium]|nr:PocR ligand-binding domain-containing protein [Bacillota bacterium]